MYNATLLRVRWLKPLPYELNVDETSVAITTLLIEEIDKNAQATRTYEEAKTTLGTRDCRRRAVTSGSSETYHCCPVFKQKNAVKQRNQQRESGD